MFSTLLWYIDPKNDNDESVFGKTVEGTQTEYAKYDGKLYRKTFMTTDPRRYLERRNIVGSTKNNKEI